MSASSPQGSRSLTELDQLNRTTKVIDPLGGITRFGYDPNGNLLSFKDAKNNETVYTLDNMDRLKTRKDPLLKLDTYEYEPGGSPKKLTDRRGLATVWLYDILGRNTFTGFKEALPLPAPSIPQNYESTITSVYDKADRLTSAVDSLSGTITLDYDPLDRLKTETTPRGSVGYTWLVEPVQVMGTFEEVQLKALRLPRRAYIALICFGLVGLALAIRLIFIEGPEGMHTYGAINTVFLLVLGAHHLYVRSKFRKGELR